MRNTIALMLLVSCSWITLRGQVTLEVWPGDVNNNGLVNEVDVLFWSVAAGESGPRAIGGPSRDWAARSVEAWEGIIPGSDNLNLALADCDGNGQINNADLQVIRENFGESRPEATPDAFSVGDSRFDPLLSFRLLEPDDEDDDDDEDEEDDEEDDNEQEERLELAVVLGDNGIAVPRFFGMAFTILYDPDLPGGSEERVNFRPARETWMGELGGPLRHWEYKDPEHGRIHNVFYRQRNAGVVAQPPPPLGEAEQIGTFSIVIVEDIVSGLERVSLGFESVRLIDASLKEQVLAIDNTTIEMVEDVTTSTGVRLAETDRQIAVFPNPVGDWLQIHWTGQGYPIQAVELFNMAGQRLAVIAAGVRHAQLRIPTGNLPAGAYWLRIRTEAGPVIRMFTKKE